MPTKQSRNWCFTDFELLDWGEIYTEFKDVIRYITWGEEICPKTHKKHLQGWIQLVNKKTFGGVKRLVSSKKIHIEACCGTEYDNNKYCQKDDKYKVKGDFIKMGQRTDLEEIKKMIDDGATMLEVAEHNFNSYCVRHKGFEKYKQMVDKKNTKAFRHVKVTLIQGPTGKNKTRRAVEDNKEDHYKIQGCELQWFDGYEGEKTIVIDDYDNDVRITKLLGLLDGYQLRLAVKGGFTYANWTNIFITTNLRVLHENAKNEHRDALQRRITKTINLFPKENECDENY